MQLRQALTKASTVYSGAVQVTRLGAEYLVQDTASGHSNVYRSFRALRSGLYLLYGAISCAGWFTELESQVTA